MSVDIHPFPTGTIIFDVQLGTDWTRKGVEAFLRYMEQSNGVVSVTLTTTTDSDTIHPCESHPTTDPTDRPLATSATC
jgi:hypothetical protein